MELRLLGSKKDQKEVSQKLEQLVSTFTRGVTELSREYPNVGITDSDVLEDISGMVYDSIREKA